jgi:Transcriptional regulator, AbiEi antitoxin N-terminal domain
MSVDAAKAMTWEGVVVSLQTLQKAKFVVGGRTALEVQGFSHYLLLLIRTIPFVAAGKGIRPQGRYRDQSFPARYAEALSRYRTPLMFR